MSRTAYFDCISGISGDMTLGALVDLGAEVQRIESAVRSMGLEKLAIRADEVKKYGFRAVKVTIEHPPEHAHRHLHHIEEMIDRAQEIDDDAKELARAIFHQLAQAEAKVHGTTIQKVHFHEVGAIDSIADIVGTAVALRQLDIDSIAASPVPTGTGHITIAHGRVSVPAPATAELLRGIPLAQSDVEAELTTPTGAAILKACAKNFGAIPAMTIQSIGYGAGTKDLEQQANVLRIILGQTQPIADNTANDALGEWVESDQVVVLETNIDDSTPQQLADCAERLMDAGALDVFQVPCTMKKGRAAVVLTALVPLTGVQSAERIIFEHTTSIGIRRHVAERHKLVRRPEQVDTAFGPIRGKVVTLPNGHVRFAVEHDDAQAAASKHRTSIEEIRRAATAAWEDR